MIEPVRKLHLFLFYKEKKRALAKLQSLGMVHLETQEQGQSGRLGKLYRQKDRYEKLMRQISAHDGSEKESQNQPDSKSHSVGEISLPDDLQKRLEFLEELIGRKEELNSALEELHQQYIRYKPLGDFDSSAIAKLSDRGVKLYFYRGAVRLYEQFDLSKYTTIELAKDSQNVYFVLIQADLTGEEGSGQEAPVIPFERLPLPGQSLSSLQNQMKKVETEIEQINRTLSHVKENEDRLIKGHARLEERIAYQQAKLSLSRHKSDQIFFIEGYYPVKNETKIKQFLDENELAYEIHEVEPDDNVPVMMKNAGPSKFFQPITKIFSLPDYFEIDPTPFFAPFFAFFFGMCFGDAGYGAVGLIISLIMLFTSKKMRPFAWLGIILSASTVLNGFLLNTFFGEPLFNVPGSKGILNRPSDITIFAAYTVQGGTQFPAMTLALLLGFVQIIFGFILQSANEIRQNGWKHGLKALGMVLITLSAAVIAVHHDFLFLGFNPKFEIGPIPVGAAFAAVDEDIADAGLIAGLILFFFFNSLSLNIFIRPLTGLWEFYQFTTGLLGDFLSYIRLFALGLASGLLGNAFNQIAFMVLPQSAAGEIQYAHPLIAVSVIILILGHTLNLGLSALGSFVHPLRLTFVEFYKNLNFKGGGRLFKPFAKA